MWWVEYSLSVIAPSYISVLISNSKPRFWNLFPHKCETLRYFFLYSSPITKFPVSQIKHGVSKFQIYVFEQKQSCYQESNNVFMNSNILTKPIAITPRFQNLIYLCIRPDICISTKLSGESLRLPDLLHQDHPFKWKDGTKVHQLVHINRLWLYLGHPYNLLSHISVEESWHFPSASEIIWARYLSLAQSKPMLCSDHHRSGYLSNLVCDWLSIVWAYSEQEAENEPWNLSWTWPLLHHKKCTKREGWYTVALWIGIINTRLVWDGKMDCEPITVASIGMSVISIRGKIKFKNVPYSRRRKLREGINISTCFGLF